MSDTPTTADPQDPASLASDAERWAQVGAARQAVPAIRPTASTDPAGGPDVGLAQKGMDEDAIVKRETDV